MTQPIATFLLLVSVATTADASVIIDFNAFPLGDFTSGAEDGFDLSSVSNAEIQPPTTGKQFAADNPGSATLIVTESSGGSFYLENIGLLNLEVTVPTTVELTGYDQLVGGSASGAEMFEILTSGLLESFSPTAGNLLGVAIKRLEISVEWIASEIDERIDTITLSRVPVPATALLIALGLAGIGYQRRKQIKAA